MLIAGANLLPRRNCWTATANFHPSAPYYPTRTLAVLRGKNGATGIALAEVYAARGDSIESVSSRTLVGTGDDVLIAM